MNSEAEWSGVGVGGRSGGGGSLGLEHSVSNAVKTRCLI